MRAEAVYAELMRRVREEALLASCGDVLAWDEETYLPRGGVPHRAEQMALLAGLEHERSADPRLGELLAAVEGSDLVRDPESDAAVNVREIRRLYDRECRLPHALVEELARITSIAQQEWLAARERSDFARFRPWLEKVVTLKRAEADALAYSGVPYDALLDEYEPGLRSDDVARLLAVLRRDLQPLIEAIAASPHRPNTAVLRREYPVEQQRAFSEAVASAIGFDFRRGRLDATTHPFFITIGPDDCRIATRYNPHGFSDAFFGMLHEVGHGLYEQGRPAEHHGTPLGDAASLGLHESQARLWENTVGRSRGFWDHFFPLARKTFPGALADAAPDEFYFAVNYVGPSLIRMRADEVTYNLHILVRVELEQALLAGNLRVADLPGAWNDAHRRYLGVVPANVAEGCLQDGHWAAGLFGYFPTYTLGNVFGAQLHARATAELGDLESEFRRGEFGGLLGWLTENVYRHGQRYPAARLMERVAGASLDHRPLVESLRGKYAGLYRV
jgi:carboxypeptidase Taq